MGLSGGVATRQESDAGRSGATGKSLDTAGGRRLETRRAKANLHHPATVCAFGLDLGPNSPRQSGFELHQPPRCVRPGLAMPVAGRAAGSTLGVTTRSARAQADALSCISSEVGYLRGHAAPVSVLRGGGRIVLVAMPALQVKGDALGVAVVFGKKVDVHFVGAK